MIEPVQEPPAQPRAFGDWEPPLQLNDQPLPPWPAEIFSGPLCDIVNEVARFTQTPRDFAGMLAVAALSVGWAGKVVAEIYPGYQEPLMLYVVIAAHSGERKSAVFELLGAPIRETPGPGGAALMVDDATPEALEALMVSCGGKAAVFGPEGGSFLDCLSSRQRGLASALYLKGHTGETHVTLRVGREGLRMDSPALTIGVMTQPSALRALGDRGGREELLNRGFCGRVLYSCPQPRQAGALLPRVPMVPAEVLAAYHRLMSTALAVPRGPTPRVMPFSSEALMAYDRYFLDIEARRRPGGDLARLSSWAPKLRGNVLRIAALLHLSALHHEAKPWQTPVTLSALQQAWQLSDYLISHAQAAFSLMSEDGDTARARKLLSWVREGRRARFTAREAQRHLARVGRREQVLNPALAVLLSHGHIRATRRGTSEIYEVNPYEAQTWTPLS